MSEENDSAYSLTLKAATGFDAPWLVVRAATIEQLHDQVQAIRESAFFATAGSAAKDFQAAYQLGKGLGAEPASPPKEPAKKTPAKKAPAEKPAPEKDTPKEEGPWEAGAGEPDKPAEDWPAEESITSDKKEEAPKKAASSNTGRPKPAWKR